MTWVRVFPGRLDQVKAAREFATLLFADTDIIDDVGFIVSELAANAIRHTRSGRHKGWYSVELALDQLAYIGVTDQGGGGYPSVRHDPLDGLLSEGGRGLLGVSQVATAFGIYGNPERGHTVWADIVCSVPARWAGPPHLADGTPRM